MVWVADEYRARFLKIFEDYLTQVSTLGDEANWDTPEGNPRSPRLGRQHRPHPPRPVA